MMHSTTNQNTGQRIVEKDTKFPEEMKNTLPDHERDGAKYPLEYDSKNNNTVSSGEINHQNIQSQVKKDSWQSMVEYLELQANIYRTKLALTIIEPDNTIQHYHYLYLHEEANKLAHYLISINQHAQEEYKNKEKQKKVIFVGVCLPKSVDLYISLLAIWKAGVIYFPLSAYLTNYDLTEKYQDVIPQFLIVNNNTINKFHTILDQQVTKVINLDDSELKRSIQLHVTPPKILINREDPAYLIYTSGTTGKAKGVLIPHDALVSRYQSHQRLLALTSNDKVLQLADIRVDVSLMEIWLAWCSGATLCVSSAPIDELMSELPDIFQRLKITAAILAPTLLKSLISGRSESKEDKRDYSWPKEKFSDLKHLISATEEAEEQTLSVWQEAAPLNFRKIYNGYGPTEMAIGAMISRYLGGTVSLGKKEDKFYRGRNIHLT